MGLRYDLAIFDLDGTLVDSSGAVCATKDALFAHFEVPAPSDAVFLSESTASYMEWYYEKGIPRTVSREKFDALWNQQILSPDILSRITLRRGAQKVLAECRGDKLDMRVALVSGNTASFIKKMLEQFGLFKFFDVIISTKGGEKKSSLGKVARDFQTRPHRAFYVDDSVHGVVAARGAGMKAIAIAGGFAAEETLRAAKPHHLVHELPDLLAILTRSRA